MDMDSEVVISGIGGAFPESSGIEDFIGHLIEGKPLASVDDRRWEPGLLGTTPYVGKIGNVHHFDNNLFKVHKPLAELMDPLGRLMLERALEAVIDAGLTPKELANTNTNVYTTTTISESESRTVSGKFSKKSAGYAIMAAAKTMMANRISYFLDLKGASVTLDGDWTVATIAIGRAVRCIRSGECDYALVGAASTALFPELNKIYERMGYLSPDGQCRPLDAKANGSFRTEGAVVFLLQRAATARRVYARLGGVGELCVGRRDRYVSVDTSPLRPLIEDVYRGAGLDPRKVKMLGADGSCVPEIEAQEMKATAEVLCARRDTPLPVSTSKAVIGQGDAVGAMMSIIHAIAAMENNVIPPIIGYEKPDPSNEPLVDGRMQVVSKPQKLALEADSVVGINLFGWSGGISHVAVQPHLKEKRPVTPAEKSYPRLIPAAARSLEEVSKVLNEVIDRPFDPEYLRLVQAAFSDTISAYGNRGFTILPSDMEGMRPLIQSKESIETKRPVWLVYSGMGCQWPGMGKGLLRLPEFARTIERLQRILDPEGIDLVHLLTSDSREIFDDIINCFVGITAIQIGLTNVLKSVGIKADGIIGHSAGEVACAYADGCLTEYQAIMGSFLRGKASIAAKPPQGMMASIGLNWKEAVKIMPASIDVACHNSAENCTISGPPADVEEFVDDLKKKNIFARAVNVANIAYHSRYIAAAGPILKDMLDKVLGPGKPRSSRWVTSSVPPERQDTPAACNAGTDYFVNNLLSAVRFEEAMKAVPQGAVVIEVAPHALLGALIRRELPDAASYVGITRRGHSDGLRCFLEGIGKIYLEGVPVKSWVLAPHVSLPVSKGTPPLAPLITWDHRETWKLVVSFQSEGGRCLEHTLYPNSTPAIRHLGKKFCTPAYLLEIVWRNMSYMKTINEFPVAFEHVSFLSPTEILLEDTVTVELMVQRSTGCFEVMSVDESGTSKGKCLLKGKVRLATKEDIKEVPSTVTIPDEQDGVALSSEDIYAELEDQDLHYDDSLKTLQRVTLGEKETTGLCAWVGNWTLLLDSLLQLNALDNADCSMFEGCIRKLVIAAPVVQAISSSAPVRFDKVQSVLTAPGIYMAGYRRAEKKTTDRVSSLEFTLEPLGQQTNKSFEDFLEEAAMFAVSNSCVAGGDHAVTIIALDAAAGKLAVSLKSALRGVIAAEATVSTYLVRNASDLPSTVEGTVVVVSAWGPSDLGVMIDILDSLRQRNPFCMPFVLVKNLQAVPSGFSALVSNVDQTKTVPEVLILLAQERVIEESQIEVINLGAGEAAPADVDSQGLVVLVWHESPREGVLGAMANVYSKPYGDRARFFVLLDKDAPRFSLNERTYVAQLGLGIAVNVLQGGKWRALRVSQLNSSTSSVPVCVRGVDTLFLGLNPRDLAVGAKPDIGALDYCGTKEGHPVMGVARRAADGSAVPDEVLCWNVPQSWTKEEAASVPLAYATAYYCLLVPGKVSPGTGEKVLVTDGLTVVGQACIRVAAHFGCQVFTTVTSEAQRKQVLSILPQLNADRVLRIDEQSFHWKLLMATKGHGVDITLSNLVGEQLHTLVSCVAPNGRLCMLTKKDALANHVGLWVFKRSAEMFASSTDTLLTAQERDKERVRAALQIGITDGVVRPFPAKLLGGVIDESAARTVRGPEKRVVRPLGNASLKEGDSRTHSYIVIGGGADTLVTVARAASSNGAKILMAAIRGSGAVPEGVPVRARFVPALAHTTFVSCPKTASDAKKLLEIATKSGGISAVIVNVEDPADYKLASLLNEALPAFNGTMKDTRLLVLADSLAYGTESVESRRGSRMPACSVVGRKWEAAKVLPTLMSLELDQLPEAVHVFRRGAGVRLSPGHPVARRRSLPSEATQKGKDDATTEAQTPTFVELTTKTPRLRSYGTRRDPVPLFAVPGDGLPESTMRETGRCVMSPMFMAKSGRISPQLLSEEILRLQPRGPWAMFGSGDPVSADLLISAAKLVEEKAGRPDRKELVNLALLEPCTPTPARNPAPVPVRSLPSQAPNHLQQLHAGTLHYIKRHDGNDIKSVPQDLQSTTHFVGIERSSTKSRDIATIINDNILSPLTKIVAVGKQ